jgi:hypothetical protein
VTGRRGVVRVSGGSSNVAWAVADAEAVVVELAVGHVAVRD